MGESNGNRGFVVPIGGGEDKTRDTIILKRFMDISGGKSARIVIIPTASQLPDTGRRYERTFRRLGARETHSLPFERRSDCSRRDWIEEIERADGVFLTGGNQLKLSTTLGGTPVAEALTRRYLKGMNIAGTSAGAAIMSEHMIAFGQEGPTPQADMVTLAPGLGFTKNLIIDQHFRQRDRMGRLLTAVSYNPTAIGMGLDEDTAAFLGPDDVLEVVGSGAITIIDPSEVEYSSMDSSHQHEPVCILGVRLHILTSGGTYDLTTRTASAPPRGEP